MAHPVRRLIEHSLASGTAAGTLLFAAAACALLAANAPTAALYTGFLDAPVELRVGAFQLAKPVLLWINDGLMAIFFLLIGLEVKREIVEGELSSAERAALPIAAAIGGMALPAAIYVAVNWASPENLKGWAIPAATDIAFALGVLALFGSRVPMALKVLLLAIAIIDDIGAIAIIALFYTAEISATALILAAFGIAALATLNRFGVRQLAPYLLVGVFLWTCVLKSGVHATLAGVVTAWAIPLGGKGDASPLKRLEHALHPWVAYAILPLFAFANAGVGLASLGLAALLAPLTLGVTLGLVIGKQIGVFGFMAAAIRLGLVRRPAGVSWTQLYGMACLTGIGFTMSLFIGSLAFGSGPELDAVKVGVLTGSLISAVFGCLLLLAGRRSPEAQAQSAAPIAQPTRT